MTRRTRSRFPELAKLASGVVIGGLGLGLVISLTVDTEMKRPPVPLAGSGEPVAAPQLGTWPAYDFTRPANPDSLPPDLAYDDVAGAEWAIEAGEEPVIPPLAEDVSEAASAAEAAAREAAVTAESAVPPRRTDLAKGGLY